MFRDESTKVIQKAHAQWGVDSSDASEASGSSPTSTSPSLGSSRSSRGSIAESVTTVSPVSPEAGRLVGLGMPKELNATSVDRAVQFYLEHFVIGLPDEAKIGQELRGEEWVFSPVTREIMAAVGFASLSNLSGDKDMMVLARQQYGSALKTTASSLANPHEIDLEVSVRAVVMMGMFETVRSEGGTPTKAAQTHIMGGAALMRSLLPYFQHSHVGVRGLLQLCFSMMATVQTSVQQLSPEPNVMIPTSPVASMGKDVLPSALFDWITLSGNMISTRDKPSAELITILSRFVQLSALVRSQHFHDGRPETFGIIREALDIEHELADWEARQEGIWAVSEERADDGFFPPDAVFEGCYHVYTDMWTARVWTNYRWARIMVNQLLLESVDRFPASSLPLLSPAQQRESLATIARVARDTLVSTPTHYRHPRLKPVHRECFDKTMGGAGIGAAQIPTMVFQLKVAGGAPGVPKSYFDWALAMMETVFADTGMIQAKRLAELLAKTREPGGARFIKWEDE
ncbi:white-opaque regulator 1 [Podospora conica]|nr:white-opaque regulator 1 [Schizothecium conicum]